MVVGFALVLFFYYRPLRNYVHTRSALVERRAEVRKLRAQKTALELQLSLSTSTSALAGEARRLGFVEPGQHLYIVKGINAWLRAHRASIGSDGR